MFFVTGNPGKFKEAVGLIPGLKQSDIHPLELQADSLEEVAVFSIRHAFEELEEPCFVEDAGLFISALNGFPGVYSKPVWEKIGLKGVLKLLDGAGNRSAVFRAVIAYHDGEKIHTFKGECRGSIAMEKRGTSGFGFDPVFVPEGHEKTFAEDFAYKQQVSHRARALKAFLRTLQPKPL
ncbi:MAG: XTP/dITP diphosphatase [Candidatus Diapherotrites archaeon]|nr:XTP/dITP diphosphatase [Candidatus Diapherotrites archaeon]